MPAANQSGQSTVTLTVRDGVGLTASTSFRLTVTPANQPPSVFISSPSSGTSFTSPGNIPISAIATDNDGVIAKVEFFQGATKLGEAVSSPYSFVWNNVATGTYLLTARATDNAGATAVSASVVVTVSGAPPSISAITDQFTPQDTPTLPIPFTVGDQSVPAGSLVVDASSSNQNLLPLNNITFGGGGASRTVTLRPAPGQSGQARIILTVRNGTLTSSTSFLLTVAAVNQPPAVSILSPISGTSFFAPATLTITTSATDNDGSISKVEFFRELRNWVKLRGFRTTCYGTMSVRAVTV